MTTNKTKEKMTKRARGIAIGVLVLFSLLIVRIGTIMLTAETTENEKIPYILERNYKFEVTDYEKKLLEFITFAEAGTTESLIGQIAIAAEVLNRMEDAKNNPESPFPETIKEILWQENQYYEDYPKWYSPEGYRYVTEKDITDSVRQAVDLALQGADPTEKELGGNGAFFHYSPKYNTEEGKDLIKSQLKIGNHQFYRSWDGHPDYDEN